MNKLKCKRMLSLQAIVQPRSITIKASALTNSAQPQGLVSKIGSFLMSAWSRIAGRAFGTEAKTCVEGKVKEKPSGSWDAHTSVALPALDPRKFGEEFRCRLEKLGNTCRPVMAEANDSAEYLEDEGFYCLEDAIAICTPTAKKSLREHKMLSCSTGVSEDKWADAYSGESDAGTASCKKSVTPPSFASPTANNLLDEEEMELTTSDDERSIQTFPFVTRTETPSLGLDGQMAEGAAMSGAVEITMTDKSENVLTNSFPKPEGIPVSWSEVNLFGEVPKENTVKSEDSDLFSQRRAYRRSTKRR
eukprot:TRINITY_DN9350_c0_g2_i3.p1 TRINITY_DN9350_c0_g2~~TRINITY_DN9350_c0_g2_i3.p1  ORF type:complete len:304 (-),score=41.46 TRINITY_DN9350_c0_g2_i3:92-1003(-)